jgi:hypothetical protein
MKINVNKILISALFAVLVICISACSASTAPATDVPVPAEPPPSIDSGNENGNGATMLDIVESELTQEEIEALLFMREEEKLARDVYSALYELWGQPVFQNIATSEQKHMDAVKLLLDRYNLADPALEPGSFSDPDLGALYDQLVAQGSVSLEEALKVGAAIEEIDILDLEERLAQTDKADIQRVFNSLKRGSYNHLNAFARVLSMRTGETYQPQHLSADAYAAIVTGQAGNGYSNGRQTYAFRNELGRPQWAGGRGKGNGRGGGNQ